MIAPKGWSTGRKLVLLGAVCALAAGGGVFAAAGPLAHPSFASEAASPERSTPGLAFPVVAPVKLDVSPVNAATQVNPGAPVTLKVSNGKIERVALTSDSGDAVKGTLSAGDSSWTASEPLKFNTRYTYTVSVLDGAGRTYTLIRIVLPLAAPGLIATAILTFLSAWGQFMVPLVFSPSLATKSLTVLIPEFVTRNYVDYGLMNAAGVVAMLPPVLLVIFLNRFLVRGLIAGATK